MNVQMNVRIDDQVKRAGDEVFNRAGLTPTQVVRSVWEYAAAHREMPELVRAAIGQADVRDNWQKQQVLQASSICARLREQFSISAPDQLEDLDYQSLREQALYERMEERGLA